MTRLMIQFVKPDEINKNSNAVIDRACQELEEELTRLAPEGNNSCNDYPQPQSEIEKKRYHICV